MTAKREFDKRMKDDELEQWDKATYYYWHNRLRRLRKTADPERVAAFKAAFDTFRKEAVRRKGLVRRKEMKPNDFTAWLAEQQDEADRLMEELVPKLD